MIRELTWDSSFFKKKIGMLSVDPNKPSDLRRVLSKAKGEGYAYLTCKIGSQNTASIRFLEFSGFYLTDIGITLAIQTDNFLEKKPQEAKMISRSIKVPIVGDIPMLQKMAKSLFLESRFYSDPFFSKRQADRLYSVWIENSVRGEAAEIVYWIPGKGFITCRKSGRSVGEIVLIGIKKNFRGKGLGRVLIEEAMGWFRDQRTKEVTVRTQLKNVNAINFYLRLGFFIREYDIVFGKIL